MRILDNRANSYAVHLAAAFQLCREHLHVKISLRSQDSVYFHGVAKMVKDNTKLSVDLLECEDVNDAELIHFNPLKHIVESFHKGSFAIKESGST